MKNANDLKNYREKYKRYYGIEFDDNYVVHHLDFDRTNNDISNLLLLPKELHERYHFYLSVVAGCADWKTGKIEVLTRIDCHGQSEYYTDEMLCGLLDVIKDCQYWMREKSIMDWNIKNKESSKG